MSALAGIPLADWIGHYGYVAVFAGALLEGETILILAGFAAHQGHLDFTAATLLAMIAGALGDQLLFWVGRASGPALLERHAAISRASDRIGAMLRRHDALLVFGIRFMYGLRIAGPVAMGALGVVPGRFACFNLLGAAVWAPLFIGGGYLFGHALQALLGELAQFEWLVLAAIVALAALWGARRWVRARGPHW